MIIRASGALAGHEPAVALSVPAGSVWSKLAYRYEVGPTGAYACVREVTASDREPQTETGDPVFCSILQNLAVTDLAQFTSDPAQATFQIETVITLVP